LLNPGPVFAFSHSIILIRWLVRRGSKDDFAGLVSAKVKLKGKIALVKYGGPFRGVKVKNAEAHGMVGVVIFTDPGDDGPQEAKGDKAYPG
jgi:N-acetylated-alpha-linked acidic dipeptidase